MRTKMNSAGLIVLLAAFAVGLLTLSNASADDKRVVATTVTVGEMCGGCVKNITAHFDKIKEVAKIKCDIKAKTVTIFPAKDIRLSALGLWETMEKIGKKPKKLVGPEGTFTSKPKKK